MVVNRLVMVVLIVVVLVFLVAWLGQGGDAGGKSEDYGGGKELHVGSA